MINGQSCSILSFANIKEIIPLESGLGDGVNSLVVGIRGGLDLHNLFNSSVIFVIVPSDLPSDNLAIVSSGIEILDDGLAVGSGNFLGSGVAQCLDGIPVELVPLALLIIQGCYCRECLFVTGIHSDGERGEEQGRGRQDLEHFLDLTNKIYVQSIKCGQISNWVMRYRLPSQQSKYNTLYCYQFYLNYCPILSQINIRPNPQSQYLHPQAYNNHTHTYITCQPWHPMASLTSALTNTYIMCTLCASLYLCYSTLQQTDNYFAAALLMLESPMIKLLLYNLVIALATLCYRLTIWAFYHQVKENEMLNMIEKIGYKLFELCYFLYIIGAGFGLQTFIALTIIFMMFIFHNIAIARSNYLIHTHVTENMSMNYRLLSHFLLMLFIDYQLVSHTFFWLFSESSDSSYILFAYYCITISMSIVEPAITFFIHFYEVYTNCPIENSDINMVRIQFIINVPRLFIQLLLSALIAYQFTLSFLLIFTLIESISEITKTFKNYNSMKSLIDKMKNLKELGPAELENEHDRVCTVCFAEITTSALLLPCKHIFHKECLRQWIIKNSNHHCPKCKKSFDFQNMKSSKLEEQIRKVQEGIKQRNAQEERVDPLGFAKDDRMGGQHQQQQNRGYRGRGQDQRARRRHDDDENDIEIVKVGQNSHLAKLERTKKQIHRPRPEGYNIGSVPFGLPTQAIYRRRPRDIAQRQRIIFINDKMIKLMKMDPAKQLLFVPEFD